MRRRDLLYSHDKSRLIGNNSEYSQDDRFSGAFITVKTNRYSSVCPLGSFVDSI